MSVRREREKFESLTGSLCNKVRSTTKRNIEVSEGVVDIGKPSSPDERQATLRYRVGSGASSPAPSATNTQLMQTLLRDWSRSRLDLRRFVEYVAAAQDRFFFVRTSQERSPLCQRHLRREFKPERHEVREQKPLVEQTCRSWGWSRDARARQNEPTLCHLKHAPSTWRHIKKVQKRNHAELPTLLGLESIANGCSKTYTSAIS